MVASRRQILRLAGILPAIAVGPAVGQIFSATDISQAAQNARRDVGRLARRVDNLLRQTVADGPERGAAAVRRFRAEQANLARELAAVFNGRVSEDDWLLIVPTAELDLVLTMRPLVIRIAPKPDEVEAALKEPLPKIAPRQDDEVDDVALMIALASLGVAGDPAVFAALRDDNSLAAALRDTAAALKARRYGLAALEFERLMRAIVLPRNIELVAGGKPERIRALYKVLTVWFVPFIGWRLFVARLLAITYQARDATAPMLR